LSNGNVRIIAKWLKIKWVCTTIDEPIFHVIGDSHAFVFRYINENKMLEKYAYLFTVIGATVQGVVNPNSKTNASRLFKRYIFWNVKRTDYLGIMLGEVDCGFVIWYRAKKYGISIEEQFNFTCLQYNSFLSYLKSRGYVNVCLFSVPLPSIKDGEKHSSELNMRNQIPVSQKERTELTLRFNKELKKMADVYHYTFINFSDDTICHETQLMDDKFRHKKITDHHMDDKEFAQVLVPYLTKWLRL